MAKSKKATSEAASTAQASPAPRGSKPPEKGKKPVKPPVRPAAPLIDTSLAAQAAAKMVAHREFLGEAKAEGAEKKESSSFKQLKESLTKPAAHGPASFLQNTAPPKKSNLPIGGPNQIRRNQTFGADVNRAGVPRRTGG